MFCCLVHKASQSCSGKAECSTKSFRSFLWFCYYCNLLEIKHLVVKTGFDPNYPREFSVKAALNITSRHHGTRSVFSDLTRSINGLSLSLRTRYRLTHANDCLDKKLYPMLVHKHRVPTQKCAVCHIYIGRWVKRLPDGFGVSVTAGEGWPCPTLCRWLTTNDQFAPSNPCLFCDKCFRMLHYDTKGNKIGQFMAFPYVDRGAFNWLFALDRITYLCCVMHCTVLYLKEECLGIWGNVDFVWRENVFVQKCLCFYSLFT